MALTHLPSALWHHPDRAVSPVKYLRGLQTRSSRSRSDKWRTWGVQKSTQRRCQPKERLFAGNLLALGCSEKVWVSGYSYDALANNEPNQFRVAF